MASKGVACAERASIVLDAAGELERLRGLRRRCCRTLCIAGVHSRAILSAIDDEVASIDDLRKGGGSWLAGATDVVMGGSRARRAMSSK